MIAHASRWTSIDALTCRAAKAICSPDRCLRAMALASACRRSIFGVLLLALVVRAFADALDLIQRIGDVRRAYVVSDQRLQDGATFFVAQLSG